MSFQNSFWDAYLAPVRCLESGFSVPGTARPSATELRVVALLQLFFLIVALFGLNRPFVSTHYVRQCFTFQTAQHVYHEGWSAVVLPKGSFTQLSGPDPDDMSTPLHIPAPRYTICRLEMPFIGIFGWPAAQLFPKHDAAVSRLVAVAFSIFCIGLLYRVLRYWFDPLPALLGTTIWTTAPLILHFGQVPMPDILATTGLVAAFYLALRGSLTGSSLAFLFALLAKLSVTPFGLPILVALQIARETRSAFQFVKLSLLWGLSPLLGAILLLVTGLHLPPGSWTIVGGYQPGTYGPLEFEDLTDPITYVRFLLFTFVSGCGLFGLLGLVFAAGDPTPRMNRLLKIAIDVAIMANYALERITLREPQYTLPILFWLIVAASFGFPRFIEKIRGDRRWRVASLAILLIQIGIATTDTIFLKASRVPNLAEMHAAMKLTPTDARVVVYAFVPNQAPPVWLNRNTLSFSPLANPDANRHFLQTRLEDFHKAGFNYLLVFDVNEYASIGTYRLSGDRHPRNLTNPSSPVRKFLDKRYRTLYDQNQVVLYSLNP
jgi:hypothetical protein